MKKIYLFLYLVLFSGCNTVLEDYIYDGQIECPKVTAPIGAEELVVKTKGGHDTYVGFRGVQSNCILNDSIIKMDLKVKIRVIRVESKLDDSFPIKLSLVSINKKNEVHDRDDFHDKIFLINRSKIVEREINMSVDVPLRGNVLLGLKQDLL